MNDQSQTPDPIAMFTEAQSDFQVTASHLGTLLSGSVQLRETSLNLKRELQELEADFIIGGLEGRNAEERKALLLQAMAEHPRVEALRKRQATATAEEETIAVDIDRLRLRLSSARARRQFATTLLAYYATAQDDRIAMTPEGTAAVGVES